MVQSGQVPDVAEVPDKWVGLYGSLGKLVDLTPYLNQTDASKNYTDLTWTAAKATRERRTSSPTASTSGRCTTTRSCSSKRVSARHLPR